MSFSQRLDQMFAAFPHLAGMLMVMVSLTVLWGLCALTAKMVAIFLPDPTPTPTPKSVPMATTPVTASAAQPTPPASASDSIAPEIVAVIAAAVAVATGGTSRIVTIKRQSPAWQMAGRQSVLSSHRIR